MRGAACEVFVVRIIVFRFSILTFIEFFMKSVGWKKTRDRAEQFFKQLDCADRILFFVVPLSFVAFRFIVALI